jgi:hypothetical protein
MSTLPVLNLIHKKKIYKTRRTCTDTADYRSLYRFDRENVKWLANHFIGQTSETRGGKLTPVHQMQVFLRYMADPGFQIGVGEELGVDQTTVSRTVREVSCLVERDRLKLTFDKFIILTSLGLHEDCGQGSIVDQVSNDSS